MNDSQENVSENGCVVEHHLHNNDKRQLQNDLSGQGGLMNKANREDSGWNLGEHHNRVSEDEA